MTDSLSHRSQRPNSDDASCEVFETGGRIYAYTYSGKLIRTAISSNGLEITPANWSGRLFRVPTISVPWSDVIEIRLPRRNLWTAIMFSVAFMIRGDLRIPKMIVLETWGMHRDRMVSALHRFAPPDLLRHHE